MEGLKVKAFLQDQFKNYVKDLEILTNIDSGNGDPEGTDRAAKFVAAKLQELGATVEYRTNERSTHLISRIKGKGAFRLLMIAHIDTVFKKGEAAKRPFRLDEKNIAYGPGVGDDKATVIQTIYAMKTMKEFGFDAFDEVILYYNGEEEGGSTTAEKIVEELSQQADMAILMDTARPGWGIVTQRKGSANYDIQVTGTAGHAGNAPHCSASAIMELGNQISRLYQLASPLPDDPHEYTREALKEKGIVDHGQFIPSNCINVGVISSTNDRINVIPADALAKLNVRCYTVAEQECLDRAIKDLANQTVVPGTQVTVSGQIHTGPMEKTPQVQKLVDIYKEIVRREYGAEVIEWVAGGVSDGNRTAKFIPTIDALGVENYEEHTDHEYVDLNTAVPRTVALVLMVAEVTEGWPIQ